MNQSEVMQRIVGILTQAAEVSRLLNEDPDREDVKSDVAIGELLQEMFPAVELPGDSSPQEIAAAVSREVGRNVRQLTAAFVFTFTQLAEYHDAGRTDISSADVLREIALRAETTWSDEDE